MHNLTAQAEKRPTAVEIPGRLAGKHERRMRKAPWGIRVIHSCLLLVVALWGIITHPAQAKSGFYLSGELGANFASGLDMTGTSNDRASVCDEFINPMFGTVTQTAGYENYKLYGLEPG